MSTGAEKRREAGLTQQEAATRAGVSVATWRRWEMDPQAVSEATCKACEAVFEERRVDSAWASEARDYVAAWEDSPRLTPRQACAISLSLEVWADVDLRDWIDNPADPLHLVEPFNQFDPRVMIRVGENRAWAECVAERCMAIATEIRAGVLPFDRPGPFIDEVLMGVGLERAKIYLVDQPDMFEEVPERVGVESGDEWLVGDEDWDAVSDGFDDECRWDMWEVPLYRRHPLLPVLLRENPPITWCD
ncbi:MULTISPECIES: helix-turn-helix transcriptional regulator [unclassified Actinomyces]|uniref:helix-turn-helix domain-containing protein n=1 Tax=unclassified Actinomyces TaxID=2609248 RepID=UPI002017797E|nr:MULTISPECIES: helix-turn-helix transcriptional regulator [unclassified Actinomyces]MCL3776865.1 helix-turn-helix transcriptional regulator [Actinomyces sp. AC-20-1]MCL3790847.1 helix-turn-helix transcriptional regulator [Actinomyces sp. 187325]MCL3793111.1 helix-turn-helix transcriptional regulator [Actinomyces sp. 186855]MCL3794668.1 helix-turn-helix transcriptional regulator [Actinomyces sp. 217892]